MELIAESIGNISLLSKLKEIPNITLKFVVTNQSQYIYYINICIYGYNR